MLYNLIKIHNQQTAINKINCILVIMKQINKINLIFKFKMLKNQQLTQNNNNFNNKINNNKIKLITYYKIIIYKS